MLTIKHTSETRKTHLLRVLELLRQGLHPLPELQTVRLKPGSGALRLGQRLSRLFEHLARGGGFHQSGLGLANVSDGGGQVFAGRFQLRRGRVELSRTGRGCGGMSGGK